MSKPHDIHNVTLISSLRGMLTPGMRKNLIKGAKVKVSSKGGWAQDSTAAITSDPESVNTRQGEDYFYWVKFETPQHDLSNDGPYESAQILSRYLNVL
ncbi:MAG: hypothetical protein ACRBCI_16045 [Cellvibrionaceae bacterium]